MKFFNTIRCPVTSDFVSQFSDTISDRNITPLKQYNDGVVAYAYLRGDNLVGASCAKPTGTGTKISFWSDPAACPDGDTGDFMQELVKDISNCEKVDKKTLYITGNDATLRGAVERSSYYDMRNKEDGSFYAVTKKSRYEESGDDGYCIEGYDEGLDASWSYKSIKPAGPAMLIDAMKGYILKHECNFEAIFKAANRNPYVTLNLKYDLGKVLDSYETYFKDLTVYINSLLRPADVVKSMDSGDKVLKSLDIDAKYREKIFDDALIDRPVTINDAVEQLYVFVGFVKFLELVKTSFESLPHLDSKTAEYIAPLLNVYGYSITKFLGRFSKELVDLFKSVDTTVKTKQTSPVTESTGKFILV